ncbi:MAG: hypothetical protein JWQ97_1819 [Phenylobacterium sp.]|nr:hypothetical protein [Phenylobacterium sp.]
MTPELLTFVRRELAQTTPEPVRAFAEILAREAGAHAVLFYGSVLRTGDLAGVLDFYVLTEHAPPGALERWLWPQVGYRHLQLEDRTLRAKVATLPLATFRRAAQGQTLDTTIWTRFVQPAALAFARDAAAGDETVAAVAAAAETAAGYAAVLGPSRGRAQDHWVALFRRTYRAEFRIETPGREREILAFHRARYDALLPLAWRSAGHAFAESGGLLAPQLEPAVRHRLRRAWRRRQAMGRPLNLARLMKAAFTFEGAARYAAWKIERHTGVAVPVTPFRERHPILAAPGVLWRLWRAKRRQPGSGRQPDAR